MADTLILKDIIQQNFEFEIPAYQLLDGEALNLPGFF